MMRKPTDFLRAGADRACTSGGTDRDGAGYLEKICKEEKMETTPSPA